MAEDPSEKLLTAIPGFYPPGQERELVGVSGEYDPMDNFFRSVMVDTWVGELGLAASAKAEAMQAMGRWEDDPYYNPLLDADNEGYERFVMDSRSPGESYYFRTLADKNTMLKRELEVGGAGWSRFLSAFVDPVTYVPIPIARGLGFVKGMKKTAMPVLGSVSASEVTRHKLDPTSTFEETAIAIGAGTILGTALGGFSGHVGRRAGGAGHGGVGSVRAIGDRLNNIFRRSDSEIKPVVQKAVSEVISDAETGLAQQGYKLIAGETENLAQASGKRMEVRFNEAKIREDYRTGFNYLRGIGTGAAKQKEKVFEDIDLVKLKDWFDRHGGEDKYVEFILEHELAHIKLGHAGRGVYPEDRMSPVAIEFERAANEIAFEKIGLDTAQIQKIIIPEEVLDTQAKAAQRLKTREKSAITLKEGAKQRRKEAKEIRKRAEKRGSQAWRTRDIRKAEALERESEKMEGKVTPLEQSMRGMRDDLENINSRIKDLESIDDIDALALKSAMGLEKINISQMPWYLLKNTKLKDIAPHLAADWMKLAHEIAGSPGLTIEGAREGVAPPVSVEMLAKQWLYPYRTAMETTDKIYLDYIGKAGATRGQVVSEKSIQFFGKKPPEGKVKIDEFRKSVGRALMNNDRPTNDPHIDEAVRAWREVFIKFEDAAKETGVFQSTRRAKQNVEYWKARVDEARATGKDPEAALFQLDEAESLVELLKNSEGREGRKYFHRMWRMDAITKNEDAFTDKLRTHFRKNPYVWVGGKLERLSLDEVNLEARVRETVATIKKEATFNDTIGIMEKGDRTANTQNRIEQLKREIETVGNKEIIPGVSAREVKEAQIRNLEEQLKKGKTKGVGGPSPLLVRKLDIDDHDFAEFLEQDIDIVGQHYVMKMAPVIEMARKFGDFRIESRMEELTRLIDDEIAANPHLEKALTKEKARLVQATEDLRDKVLGVFGVPDNPDALHVKVLRNLKAWNVLSLMGKAWMAALADGGRVVMSEGFGNTFGGLVKNMTDRLEKGPASEWYKGGLEVEQAGEALDVAMATRMHQISDIGGGYHGMGKLEKWIHQQTGPFFFVNLLSVWTDNAKRFAGTMIQSRMIEDSIKWTKGELPVERIERLAAVGIDLDWAKRVVRQWEEAGSQKGESLFLANTAEWSDQEAVRTFRAILATEVNNAVITPGAADKFNFMSKPLGSVLMQYRGFGLSATQRIMMSALQQKDKSALAGITSMIALAAAVDYARRPDWVELDTKDIIFRSVERSGITGIFSDINSAIEMASGGELGLRPVMGVDQVIKDPNWAQRTGAPLGPVASQWLQFAYALSDSGATGNEQARAIRYMLPYQNLWFWSDTWTRAQRTLAEELEE